MNTSIRRTEWWANTAMVMLVAAIMFGCNGNGSPAGQIQKANDSNIKRLATLYGFHHQLKRYQGPANEDEFRSFIQSQDPARLLLAGVDPDSLDELFVGERDGAPLEIRYGANTRLRGPSLPVVFESQGVDGQFQVGFANGPMREVDQDERTRLWSGEADNDPVKDLRPTSGR